MGNAKSSACDSGNKPADRASCNLGQCPHWKIGDWAEVCVISSGNMILSLEKILFISRAVFTKGKQI